MQFKIRPSKMMCNFGVILFCLAGLNCARTPTATEVGTGTGSTGTTTGSVYTGTNPTTPIIPSLIPAVTTAVDSTGTNLNGTSGAGDLSGITNALGGISSVNPSGSPISTDSQNQVTGLLSQAATEGAASVDGSRTEIGAQVITQALKKLPAYAPLLGDAMVGNYKATCPALKGQTDGNITLALTGISNSFNFLFNWPSFASGSVVANMDGGAGQLTWAITKANKDYIGFRLEDDMSLSSSKKPQAVTIYMPNYSGYLCGGTKGTIALTQTQNNNPDPARVAQGMKSLASAYRMALLLESPLFDTMFNNMPSSTVQTLLLSAMNIAQ